MNRSAPPEEPSFFEHRFKCCACSLHFSVFSFFEHWPVKRELPDEEPKDPELVQQLRRVFCPECGTCGLRVSWVEKKKRRGFFFCDPA